MSTVRHETTYGEMRIGSIVKGLASSDRAARLSLVWTFALMNYLYCDVLGLFDVNTLNDLLNGTGPVHMTQGFLLGSAVLMEIPIAMVLLSIVLPFTASKWASIAAGTTMTLVQVGSLFVGGPTIYYAFFSAIEIATTAFIVWYAWTWQRSKG